MFRFFQVAVLSRSCSEGCSTSEHRDLWCFVGPVGNGFWQPQSLPSLLWPPMTLRLVSQWSMPCTKRTCRFTSQEMLFGTSNFYSCLFNIFQNLWWWLLFLCKSRRASTNFFVRSNLRWLLQPNSSNISRCPVQSRCNVGTRFRQCNSWSTLWHYILNLYTFILLYNAKCHVCLLFQM